MFLIRCELSSITLDGDQGREIEVGNERNEEMKIHRRSRFSRIGCTMVLIYMTKVMKGTLKYEVIYRLVDALHDDSSKSMNEKI